MSTPQNAPHRRPSSIDVPPPTANLKSFAAESECESENFNHKEYADVNTQTKKRNGHAFGIPRGETKVNDPLDFVGKLPEDPEYEEMGETARLWKIFLQERGKVDADKVQNWKDALDILLVFAGLFSAVVSSFVTQTYQSMQVDNLQFISLLTVELVGLQRAIGGGLDVNDVAATDVTPLTNFHPTLTATWLNGLWFVSLVLSLTVALAAGLTKQWVNEYLDSAAQAGKPRALSRIKQFRAVQLEVWHVPAIIGLLPVLMHIALGVFLVGLIVFLFTLSTPLTIAISIVAAGTVATYLSTTFLPLYDLSCPYKTPLTNYLYLVHYFICNLEFPRRWLSYLRIPYTVQSDTVDTMPSSLKDAEDQLVSKDTESLDVQVAMWLYSVSANSSIQRCILESLSSIPLTSVNLILETLSNISSSSADFAIRRVEYFEGLLKGFLRSTSQDSVSSYLRLRRTLLRFAPASEVEAGFIPKGLARDGESLPALLSLSEPHRAANYIRKEILSPKACHDIVVWTQILRNALYSGRDWLDIGDGNSLVWQMLMQLVPRDHQCEHCAQISGSPGRIYCVPLLDKRRGKAYYDGLTLTAIEPPPHDNFRSTQVMTIHTAVKWFLIPSFCELLFRFHTMTSYALDIPSDVRLRLDLIQSPVIQRTSRIGSVTTAAALMIRSIQESIGMSTSYEAHIQHPNIPHTTFDVLKYVISAETQLCDADVQGVIHAFFRTILITPKLVRNYRTWITKPLAQTITEAVLFGCSVYGFHYFTAPPLSEALQVAVRTGCPFLLPQIYRRMREYDWLRVLAESRLFLDTKVVSSKTPRKRDERQISFLVAAYIRGLAILCNEDSNEYAETMVYIQQPTYALELCQILLMADSQTRHELHTLVALFPPVAAGAYLRDMTLFLRTPKAQEWHGWRMAYLQHPYTHGALLHYDSMAQLREYLTQFISSQFCVPSSVPVTVRL